MATSDADRAAQQAFHRLSGLRLRHESMHSALNEVVNLNKTTLSGASEVSVSLVAKTGLTRWCQPASSRRTWTRASTSVAMARVWTRHGSAG